VSIDVFETNCSLFTHTKNILTRVSYWSKKLSEQRKLFNGAKRTKASADWESFKSSQHDYSKTIVIAKRKSWKKFCEDIESALQASRLGRILSKDDSSHLGYLNLSNKKYIKSVEKSLRHLMFHFPEFRGNSMCLFKRDRTQSGIEF